MSPNAIVSAQLSRRMVSVERMRRVVVGKQTSERQAPGLLPLSAERWPSSAAVEATLGSL
jgi:hypothetical protein